MAVRGFGHRAYGNTAFQIKQHIAQSFGAGDREEVRRRVGQLVWLGLLFSALITLVAAVWTDDLLHITQTPDEIYDEAYCYSRIVFMGAAATILYNLASGVLRAMGDSRTPLFFLMGAVGINVVLDVVFMKLVGMGVEGAAYATVLSQALSGAACLLYIRKRIPMLRLTRDDLRPDARRMRMIAAVGVPMGLQFSITAVGSIMVQSAVNGLGTTAVAAVSASTKVHMLVSAPLESCGIAMATYCGQNLGAKELRRIRSGVNAVTVMSFCYCAAAFAFNYFLGVYVAEFFIDGSQTAILANVHRYLTINAAAYPLLAVIFIFRNSLQGMGFSKQAMGAGLAELVARALVAFGLVGSFGFSAVCLASPVAWLFADVLLLTLYHVEMRKLNRAWSAETRGRRHDSLVSVCLRRA